MRTLQECLLVVLPLTRSAGGLSTFAEPKTNPVLEDRVGKWLRQPVASLATTSERRVVLVRIDKDDKKGPH